MSTIITEFKFRNLGPRITTWGENPLLVYLYNIIDGKKVEVDCHTLPPGHYYQFGRNWFTNWMVEVFEWNKGKLVKAHTSTFDPYNKRTHFFLAEFDSLEQHYEYTKACLDYIDYWKITDYSIETPHAHELIEKYPGYSFSHKILDPENCYVSYEIQETPSSFSAYENYGVSLLNEEVVNYNSHHPYSPSNQTPYELATSILFGPDYKTIPRYIPQDWTLAKK